MSSSLGEPVISKMPTTSTETKKRWSGLSVLSFTHWNSFSFSVNYNQDNTRCMAKLYQCVKDKTDTPDHRFFVSVELVGIFEVSGPLTDEDKRDFHVACYQQLFPYAELLAKQTCAAGGMPNFLLLRQRMTRDNVVVNRPANG